MKKISLFFLLYFTIFKLAFSQNVAIYSNLLYESERRLNFDNTNEWLHFKKNNIFYYKFNAVINDTIHVKLNTLDSANNVSIVSVLPIEGHLSISDYNYRNKEINYSKKFWEFNFTLESKTFSGFNSPIKLSSLNKYDIISINVAFFNKEFYLPMLITGAKLDIQTILKNNASIFKKYKKEDIYFKIISFIVVINDIRYAFHSPQ